MLHNIKWKARHSRIDIKFVGVPGREDQSSKEEADGSRRGKNAARTWSSSHRSNHATQCSVAMFWHKKRVEGERRTVGQSADFQAGIE